MTTALTRTTAVNGTEHGPGAFDLAPTKATGRGRMPEIAGGAWWWSCLAIAALWWQARSTDAAPSSRACATRSNAATRSTAADLQIVGIGSDDTDRGARPKRRPRMVIGRVARTDLPAGALITGGAVQRRLADRRRRRRGRPVARTGPVPVTGAVGRRHGGRRVDTRGGRPARRFDFTDFTADVLVARRHGGGGRPGRRAGQPVRRYPGRRGRRGPCRRRRRRPTGSGSSRSAER